MQTFDQFCTQHYEERDISITVETGILYDESAKVIGNLPSGYKATVVWVPIVDAMGDSIPGEVVLIGNEDEIAAVRALEQQRESITNRIVRLYQGKETAPPRRRWSNQTKGIDLTPYPRFCAHVPC